MTARGGPPPRNDAAGSSPKEPALAAESDNSTTNTAKGTTPPQHIGRYAAGWRAGFQAGAFDALRRAGRALADLPDTDVYQLAVIEDMTDAYQLASSDD